MERLLRVEKSSNRIICAKQEPPRIRVAKEIRKLENFPKRIVFSLFSAVRLWTSWVAAPSPEGALLGEKL